MAGNYAGLAVSRIILQFVAKTDDVDAALRSTHKGLSELAIGTAKLGTSFLAFGATANQVFTRMLDPMKESIKLASELNTTLNAVTNVMDVKGIDGAQRYRKELKELSRTFGIELVDSVKSFRTLIEAGIPDNASVNVLRKSAILAKVSMTDMNTSIETSRTLLNAFKNDFDLSTAISQIQSMDRLLGGVFRGIDFAAGSAEQLLKSLQNIVPIAAEVGISPEETIGGVAALNRTTGLELSRAATAYSNVLFSFIKPTDKSVQKTKELNKELGLTGENALELSQKFLNENGVIGALEKFYTAADASGRSAEVLAQIFSRKGAAQGVFGFKLDDLQTFKDYMESVKTGAADVAIAFEQMQDPTFKVAQFMAQVSSASESLGRSALPAIAKALDLINPKFEILNKYLEKTPATLSVITSVGLGFASFGALLAQILTQIGFVSFGLIALNGVFNALVKNPSMSIFKKLWTDVTKDLTFFTNAIETVSPKIKAMLESLAPTTKSGEGIFTSMLKGFTEFSARFKSLNFVSELNKIEKSALGFEKSIQGIAGLRTELQSILSIFKEIAKAFTTIEFRSGAFIKKLPNAGSVSIGDARKVMADFQVFIDKWVLAAAKKIRSLGAAADEALGAQGIFSTGLNDIRDSAEAVIARFESLKKSFSSIGTGGKTPAAIMQMLTQEVDALFDSMTHLQNVSKAALAEIAQGEAIAQKMIASHNAEIRALGQQLMHAINVRKEYLKTAEGIAAALDDIGFTAPGKSPANAIDDYLKSLGLAGKEGGFGKNFFTALFQPLNTASLEFESQMAARLKRIGVFFSETFGTVGRTLATLAKALDGIVNITGQVAKSVARLSGDFIKWGVAIEAITDLFRIFGESVGLVMDLMNFESGFDVITQDTRNMLDALSGMNVIIDRNSLAIIRTAEESARWANILKSLNQGFIYILKSLENFDVTAQVAFANVIVYAAKAAKSLLDLFNTITNSSLGIEIFDTTKIDNFIRKIQEFTAEANKFVSGKSAQWDITKQAEQWNDTLEKTISKYDAIRVKLRAMIVEQTESVKKMMKDGAPKEQIDAYMLSRRKEYEMQIAYAEKMQEATSEETEQRLEEFKKQADNRRIQLETELSMFNDYYDNLKRAEQDLQSELSKAIGNRDQALQGIANAQTPQEYNFYVQQLQGVQTYIETIRDQIAQVKREILESELAITAEVTANWEGASTNVTASVGAISDAVYESAAAAVEAEQKYDAMFKKMSQGLTETQKEALAAALATIKSEHEVLYNYLLLDWSPRASDVVSTGLAQTILNNWEKNGAKWSADMTTAITGKLEITMTDVTNWAQQYGENNSIFAGMFDAIEKDFKTQVDTHVPNMKQTLIDAVVNQFGGIPWKDIFLGATVALKTGSLNKGAAAATASYAASNYISDATGSNILGNVATNTVSGALAGSSAGWWGAGIGAVTGAVVGVGSGLYQDSKDNLKVIEQAYRDSGYSGSLFDFAVAIVNGEFPQYDYAFAGARDVIGSNNSFDVVPTMMYAKGGQVHMGGVALVGEEGPELVELPAGSKVKTARETSQIMGGRIPAYAGGTDNPRYMQGMYNYGQGGSIQNANLFSMMNDPNSIAGYVGEYLRSIGMQPGTPAFSQQFEYFMQNPAMLRSAMIRRNASNAVAGQNAYSNFSNNMGNRITQIANSFRYAGNPDYMVPNPMMQTGENLDYLSGAPTKTTITSGNTNLPGNYYGMGGANYNSSYPNANANTYYPLGAGEHTRPRGNPYAQNNTQSMTMDGGMGGVVMTENGKVLYSGQYYTYDPRQGFWYPEEMYIAALSGEMDWNEVAGMAQNFGTPQQLAQRQAQQSGTGPLAGKGGPPEKPIPAKSLSLGSPRRVGMASKKVKIDTSKGEYSYNREYQTDVHGNKIDPRNSYNHYTGFTEDRITSFIGDLEGIAKTGKFKGIPEFEQALSMWRKMSVISKKYGYSNVFLAQNSGLYSSGAGTGYHRYAGAPSTGVSMKPSKVSDEDVMSFQLMYKQVLALFKAAQDKADKLQGKKERGGSVNIPGMYMVGEAGPEMVELPYGSNVVPHGVTRTMQGGGGTMSRSSGSGSGSATFHGYAPPNRRGSYGGYRAPSSGGQRPTAHGIFPGIGNKKSKPSAASMLEKELRAAPLDKVKEFVRSAIPNGTSVLDFKNWNVSDLVDYIMSTVLVQSTASDHSLYSMWTRIKSTSNGNSYNNGAIGAFGNAGNKGTYNKRSGGSGLPTDDGRRTSGGGFSGGKGGGGGFSGGGSGGIRVGEPNPNGPGQTSKNAPNGSVGKASSKEGPLRQQLINSIPGMDLESMELLLKLLIGTEAAEGVIGEGMEKSELAKYIVGTVLKDGNVSTATLQEYYNRAVKDIASAPKKQYIPPKKKMPKGPIFNGGGRGGGNYNPATVSTVSSISQRDNSNTPAMNMAVGSAVSGEGGGGNVTQQFNVGTLRSDEDIHRLAIIAKQKAERSRRRVFG